MDKSWEQKAEDYYLPEDKLYADVIDEYSKDAYLLGAEEFQQIAIEKFNKEIKIFTQGNTEEARIATKVFKSVVEILENLKCE